MPKQREKNNDRYRFFQGAHYYESTTIIFLSFEIYNWINAHSKKFAENYENPIS